MKKPPTRQPVTRGVTRGRRTTQMHEEVLRNLQQIAAHDNKSFSYVVAEIVYAFFGLKIDKDTVKVLRRKYRQKKNLLLFKRVS